MLYRGGENVHSDVVPDFILTDFSIAIVFSMEKGGVKTPPSLELMRLESS